MMFRGSGGLLAVLAMASTSLARVIPVAHYEVRVAHPQPTRALCSFAAQEDPMFQFGSTLVCKHKGAKHAAQGGRPQRRRVGFAERRLYCICPQSCALKTSTMRSGHKVTQKAFAGLGAARFARRPCVIQRAGLRDFGSQVRKGALARGARKALTHD